MTHTTKTLNVESAICVCDQVSPSVSCPHWLFQLLVMLILFY